MVLVYLTAQLTILARLVEISPDVTQTYCTAQSARVMMTAHSYQAMPLASVADVRLVQVMTNALLSMFPSLSATSMTSAAESASKTHIVRTTQ